MTRYGFKAYLAALFAFLASDEAPYFTGSSIVMDGGEHLSVPLVGGHVDGIDEPDHLLNDLRHRRQPQVREAEFEVGEPRPGEQDHLESRFLDQTGGERVGRPRHDRGGQEDHR